MRLFRRLAEVRYRYPDLRTRHAGPGGSGARARGQGIFDCELAVMHDGCDPDRRTRARERNLRILRKAIAAPSRRTLFPLPAGLRDADAARRRDPARWRAWRRRSATCTRPGRRRSGWTPTIAARCRGWPTCAHARRPGCSRSTAPARRSGRRAVRADVPGPSAGPAAVGGRVLPPAPGGFRTVGRRLRGRGWSAASATTWRPLREGRHEHLRRRAGQPRRVTCILCATWGNWRCWRAGSARPSDCSSRP